MQGVCEIASSMVRMEKSKCLETKDAIDRISNLPDVVLEHILSFLSTKEAVETCVLSKRWKCTWACVPVLDINLEEFRGPTYGERVAKFERFVKGVLQNREPSNLEKFKLVCYMKGRASYNSGALVGCILQAMKFKPQVLSLSVFKPGLLSFDTDPIFTCASLHNLVLEQNCNGCYLEIAPSSIHLPFLKKLHLTHVTVNDEFVRKLFFGCPILEELFLHDCMLNVHKISSAKLKKLVLLDCILEQYLKISTPVLLELKVRGCETLMAPIGKFSLENIADEFADGGFKLLTSLSNITSLDLQLYDPQFRRFLEKEVSNCPIFNNLKTLILGGWCLGRHFELVAFFLHSPNLQRITLYNHNDPLELLLWELEDDTDKKSRKEEAKGALFQREQLEIVKIIKPSKNNKCVDKLVDKLHAHVKTIGKTIII